MDSVISKLFYFIVVVSILITVHEFGHFWVARRLGVKVLRFSIGFGKPLWQKVGQVDGTEYVIAAVPLGGYVKMLDEREGEVSEQEVHRAFNRQSLPVRSAIVAAGPLFNFLFAILAFWLVFVSGDTGMRPLVGEVKTASLAAQAGFEAGDEVLSVGDRETPTWELVVYGLLAESGGDGEVHIRVRDTFDVERIRVLPSGELSDKADEGDFLENIGIVRERPVGPPILGEVMAGKPADLAGLKEGDRIIQYDGEPATDADAFVAYIQKRAQQDIRVKVDRNSTLIELTLRPVSEKQNGEPVGKMGAYVLKDIPEEVVARFRAEVQLGPADAITASVQKTWDTSVFILKMVGRMVTLDASIMGSIGGPLTIAQAAAASASLGLVYFLKLLALVSISLAVLNLLPIPVLDGGHLAFFLIEAIKGSPPSEEMLLMGQRIGLVILILLMGLAFYVDIVRQLG
jgi:regulator of sigma E protease